MQLDFKLRFLSFVSDIYLNMVENNAEQFEWI